MTKSDDEQPDDGRDESPPEDDEARRRRLAEVFGDVLPDTTSDERDPESADRGSTTRDEWYRDQVPPHHG